MVDIKTNREKQAELKASQAEWEARRAEWMAKKAELDAESKRLAPGMREATAKAVAAIKALPPKKRAELRDILGPKIAETQKQLDSIKARRAGK
jgi:hypothetical protein